MKKILLSLGLFVFLSATYAQDTSFEASEGYQLGEINGQNGWQAISFLSEMFTVSNEEASDGNNALKLGLDATGFIPDGTTIGPTRNIAATLPNTLDTFEISASLYITSTEDSEGEIDFNIYGAAGTETLPGASIALLNGKVLIVEMSDFSVGAEVTVQNETFIDLTFQFDFINEETLYYLEDDLIYTGDLNISEITAYGFYTTGKAVGFVDNITTVINPNLGIQEVDKNAFSHYTKENRLYLESSSAMKSVKVYNLNGQEVMSQSLGSTKEIIAVESLSPGVYLARLVLNDTVKDFKFIRKN